MAQSSRAAALRPAANLLANARDSVMKQGHEAGSCHFKGDGHGERGGRHYITSMATMMLEVYYRHMPIYRKVATDDDFVL